MTTWVEELTNAARQVYSQTGEEGVLEAIFAAVGETNRHLVDIGAGDGTALSNTRLFLEQGWHGARFDAAYAGDVSQARITAENVCDVLAKYNTPGEFDLLSLDIDGIDWYVLRALLRGGYAPRVIVCEVNNALPPEPAQAIAYDPAFVFGNNAYFGATVAAYRLLGEAHGYVLAHVRHFNAFLVRADLVPADAAPQLNHVIYSGWPPDPRPWVQITAEDCR